MLQNNEELVLLNENIEEQKRKIQKIHDDLNESIVVTKVIQEALLTKDELIKSYLDDYFILYKPKEQASGDFYYLNKSENKLTFTVADCTGHGVPGGFLTALSISYLHDIIRRKDIDKPAQALELLRKRFIELGLGMHFGIDMALCIIDTQTNVIHYSGAYNPLIIISVSKKTTLFYCLCQEGFKDKAFEVLKIKEFTFVNDCFQNKNNAVFGVFLQRLIRDNELIEVKGNRIPVSFYITEESFSNQEIELKNNDLIYFFSDGYKDQFGGERNRKFSSRRFKNLLLEIHQEPMHIQKEIVINTLNNWKKDSEQVDDITILSIKWKI